MVHQDASLDTIPSWRELLPALVLFLTPGSLIIACLALMRSDPVPMIVGIALAAVALTVSIATAALLMRLRRSAAAHRASPATGRQAAPRARAPATAT